MYSIQKILVSLKLTFILVFLSLGSICMFDLLYERSSTHMAGTIHETAIPSRDTTVKETGMPVSGKSDRAGIKMENPSSAPSASKACCLGELRLYVVL